MESKIREKAKGSGKGIKGITKTIFRKISEFVGLDKEITYLVLKNGAFYYKFKTYQDIDNFFRQLTNAELSMDDYQVERIEKYET